MKVTHPYYVLTFTNIIPKKKIIHYVHITILNNVKMTEYIHLPVDPNPPNPRLESDKLSDI